MGFFSKKKKQQQQHPSQQQQRDDTSSSASRVSPSPEPSLHSPSLRTQRLNSNTSSRFSNPFRSSSFSSAPPSPSTSSNNNRHDPHHHRTPDQLFPTPSNGPPRDGHANLRVDTRQSRQESSWEDLGVRESASPTVYSQDADQREGSPVASLHLFKLFSGGGGSTVSLPLPQAARRESMEQETLREQHHLSHMAQQQQAHELEVEKKSRWKLGRGAAAKRRSGSVGSTLSMSQVTGVGGLGIGGSQSGHGGDVEEDGGFFVRSFRTVSRVQDPISTGPYESLPPGSSPPLPALPPPSPQSEPHRLSFDHDSHRSMAPPSSSSARPARPPPTRSPGSGSWTNVADRAPSPTISVEAFRFASSRSKSTVSLVSMGDDAPLERPRFELRESRRGSFNSQSDVGVGALAPPRPQYARQHSRSTSNNSEGSSDGRGGQMNPSDSITSVASYSTAPERPHLSREASSETELKLIAMYGGSPQLTQGTLTPSNSTPFISTLPFESDSADLNVEHLHTAASTPARTEPIRRAAAQRDSTPTGSSAPSVAVQPPTPVPDPTFVPPPQRHAKLQQQSPTTARGRTVSAMAATTAKGKARGWNSDSSEEEDKEEDSDDDSDDDDVPLANIRSRSQTDLSFYANHNASTPQMLRKGSSEVEVLAEPSRSPPKAAAAAPSPRESIGRGTPPLSASSAAALLRQGSQRRSVSTLSFSNPTHAPSLSLTTPPHPNLAYRSHSNPSSPAAAAHTLLPMSTSSSLLPSLTSSVSTTPTMSAASSFQPRIVSSSSSGSGSGSGSGSSAPRTPKDHSPAVSDLGMKSNGSTARSSVLGSGGSISILADDLDRRVKFADDNSSAISLGTNSKFGPSGRAAQRMSAQPLGSMASGRSSAEPPRSSSIPNLHQSSLSVGGAPRGSVIGTGTAGGGGGAGRPGSLASFAPGSRQQQRSPTTPTSASSTIGPSSATPRESGSVFDRMKQRHKAETLSAIALGKDLNGPDGAIDDEEDEDDDEPLASLPARRGSQAGSMYAGSMMGGMGGPMQSQHQFGQQQWGGGHAHQSSFGGYSPLAMAPPGVDPYLYASLPNDQKMQLHQRSQQMMQMMAQAAYQAKAESQAGWDTGSNLSGVSGSGGAGGNHSQRGSVASFGSFNGGGATNMGMPMMGMGMPMMGYGGGQMLPHPPQAQAPPSPSSAYSPSSYSTMPRGARLPPFAPSLAMSQSMFQAPMYAGSAIGGFGGGGGGGSMMGMPTSSPSASARGSRESLGGGKRASASALGTGRR